MFIAYGSFALILSNQFKVWVMWLLSAIMGFALAGVGLCIMHEANHGAYNKSQVYQLFGWFNHKHYG